MSSRLSTRLWIACTALLPLLIVAVQLRTDFQAAVDDDRALRQQGERELPEGVCTFPGDGPDKPRVVLMIVDSLRAQTAWDPDIMPFLSGVRERSLWGRMTPCLSQLSLLCERTMLEGREPLFVTGLTNFTGMEVQAPSLLSRLKGRGAHIAMVADHVAVDAYAHTLAWKKTFADRPEPRPTRDHWSMKHALELLDDPAMDVAVILIIDTDSIAHREGIHTEFYRAYFRETDDFLREFVGRLRPGDSVVILGDHGHDAAGSHSTGVHAPTTYFALGPAFATGRRIDVNMATTYFLLGVPSCQPVQGGYRGQLPLDALTVPADYGAAYAAVTKGLGEALDAGDADPLGTIVRWTPALLLTVVCLLLLFGWPAARRARRRSLVVVGTLLLGGLFVRPDVLLWAAAVAGLVSLLPWRLPVGWLARTRWVGLALQVVSGALAFWLVVTLQNNVNPRWMFGFWAVLGVLIAGLGFALRRVSGLPLGRALPLVAWALVFYGLFLGPYYYGTARNILFALTWLLLAAAVPGRRAHPGVLRWALIAVVALLPLHLPLMKEWFLRYPVLEPLSAFGPVSLVAGLAAVFGAAVAAAPERRALLRAGLALVVWVGIGLGTDVPHQSLAGCALLILSYAAFDLCAERLDDRWLRAIGQASYAFMFAFVSIRGLRFANFQFDFALDAVDPSRGELYALVAIQPVLVLRYLVPFGLLAAVGAPVGRSGLGLFAFKLASLFVFVIGMQLAAEQGSALFERLAAQELLCLAIVLLTLSVVAALGIGRSPASQPSGERAPRDP